MRKWRFSSKAPDPRVLCVSYRDIALVISRCGQYEFEDLIATMDAVDVIAPADLIVPEDADTPVQVGILTLQRLAVKTFRRLKVKLEGTLPYGWRWLPSGLSHNYEMLLVNCEAPGDLYDLAPCAMWRSKARVSVCVIQELYASDVPKLGDILKILKQFDHIIVSHSGHGRVARRGHRPPVPLCALLHGHAQVLPVSRGPAAGHRLLRDGS